MSIELKLIHVEPPEIGQSFVAVYDDRSGGNIFKRTETVVKSLDPELVYDDLDHLQDAGYCFWFPAPDCVFETRGDY